MAHEPPASTPAKASEITASLRALRARLRARLIAARTFMLIAALLGAAVLLGVTDYLLRLPEWIRWLHWFIAVAAVAAAVWRFIRPAWRFDPSLTDLALRVERERPELGGLLASAVDFAEQGDASRPRGSTTGSAPSAPPLSESLARAVLARAEQSWRAASLSGIIRNKALARSALSLTAAAVAAAALYFASPSLWSIGALRLAAPWAGAAWPKRTGVIDLTEGAVHARGTALPLRAAVIKSNRPWESTYVAVRYRLLNGEETAAERRELLTWQRRDTETANGATGALFERLIEPAADAVEFRFETEDDATLWRRLRLVPPPAVVEARAVITPPEYARRLADSTGAAAEPVSVALGPGTDDRAVAPPSLAGSSVELTITLNKPVEMPETVAELFVDPETPLDTPGRARIQRRGTTWTINWTLNESLRVPIRLRDEHDIESIDEAVFRFEALADRPAAATITEPGSDRTVLPTALVPVTAEGRDDVGLAWVALEQSVWSPAGREGARSGPGGALEQRGEPVESARAGAVGSTIARASVELDLAPLELRPGDEVRLVALAIDARGVETEGVSPTRSAPRTLRIISEQQFVEEIQRTLAEVRQAAIRIDEQQAGIREQTEAGRADQTIRRAQGAVTERLTRQSDTVARLGDRVRENRIEDRGLEELLARARSTINDAGQASTRAAQSLEQASSTDADDDTRAPAPTPPSDSGQQGGTPSPSDPSSQGRSPTQTPPPSDSGQQGGTPSPSDPSSQGRPRADSQPSPSQPAQPSPEQPSSPDLREAAQAQQDVQDHLRNLIELLDRGEDNWLARNTIERLAREQKELRQATQQAGQSTAGKSADQLTPSEQSELDRIVERQNALADQAAELARDLRQREQALRQKDPAAAQGMAQAARRAEQSQVSQTMKNAASEARQNQTARASRQQQQAEQTLEEMLEDLNRVDKARDEVLRRELASIIETLEGLIRQQEAEIEALDDNIRAKRGLAGLDEGMIRLNRNTLGAIDQAKEAGPEAAPIATLISRASDAQTGAITEIRRPIVGATMVRELEERSLSNLRQALEKAKQIDQAAADRERRKKLAELKKAYRDLLERQVSIRSETEPLAAAAELSRRDRQLARALAERQDAVGADLRQMLTRTRELQDAKVFDYAHVRMDALSRTSSISLADARASDARAAQNSLITLLRNVIESLNDPKPDEQKFSEGAAGGGGGGGGGGEAPLIPPLKELILLRQMQTDLADQTIELSRIEGGAPPAAIADLANSQRELMNVGREFVDRMKKSDSQAPGLTPAGVEPAKPENPEPEAPKEPEPDAP